MVDLLRIPESRGRLSHLFLAQKDKQLGVAHHMRGVVDHEIIDQSVVILPNVAHRHAQLVEHGRQFFDLRLEVGAVAALRRRNPTQEAENMTSQNLGSPYTFSLKFASVSYSTPYSDSDTATMARTIKILFMFNQII
jgi:hypothetical protein